MRILHISGAKGWGGNEQQVIDILSSLEKLNVTNTVLGIKSSPLEAECENNKINFISATGSKLNTFTNYKYLKKIVNELKPDIIHLHTGDSATLYTIADLLFQLKTKAVFSRKNICGSGSFFSTLKYNYKNIETIICVSEAVKTAFLKKMITKRSKKKLIVIYDGINLNRNEVKNTENINELFPMTNNKFIIGNIANHTRAKDLPTLINMMKHLVHVEKIQNIHLLQLGRFSDKLTPVLQNLINEYGLQDYITLGDFHPHAIDFLSQFDLYVMSSEREGLPLTIYEAFLKKTPIVTTKAGGIPEAITHDYNGYLSDIKDYKNLAKNIKLLMDDTDKKKIFTERSYKLFYDKFTTEKSAKDVLDTYSKLIC